MKQTALYDEHLKLGAKMIEYAGYLLPVSYQGLVEEHLAVRNDCGVFDVSHMGEILITGKEAKAFVNFLISNSISDVKMRMTYGVMMYPDGGIVDDLMAYYFNDNKFILVVNASNLDKDLEWMLSVLKDHQFDVNVLNISNETSQLAFQGQNAVDVLQEMTEFKLETLHLFDFAEFKILDHKFLVSRSGYTGEDGFEIYGFGEDIVFLFQNLMNRKVTPCGLGARDTLRFEANLPLYGHEIDRDINPLEATLSFAINLNKSDFIGKESLLAVKEKGLMRKIVGLELLEKGIARSGYQVEADDKVIGYITTGYQIPGTNKVYALAMVEKGYWDIGKEVNVRIRKNLVKAVVRNKKFLNKKYFK